MAEKLKLAIPLGATCSGCDIAILDLHEKILDVIAAADIVYAPTIVDTKYEDVEAMPDGSIDVALYHGAVRNADNEHSAHLLRRKSKVMVAFGACACYGGIPGLANVANRQQIFDVVYGTTQSTVNPEKTVPQMSTKIGDDELALPEFYDQVYRLADKVEVDYFMPGCPPVPDIIAKAVELIVEGELPPKGAVIAGEKTVCDECELEKAEKTSISRIYRSHEIIPEPGKCLLDQGLICMGPATQGGCGAQCTRVNMTCRGCMGPTAAIVEQGGSMLTTVASVLGLAEESALTDAKLTELLKQMKDPLGTFYRFSLPCAPLKVARSA